MAIVKQKSYVSVSQVTGALGYRAEINGLRALAVLAVIANHYHASLLPFGYLGVDVFFVISGFVIAGALVGRTDESLGAFLAGFYARRAKRLLPALVLCVTVTALFISFFVPAPRQYLMTGFFALFGLSNLRLFLVSTDYFADSTALNPFTHTWSLGVEEQFYFVFPLLVWVGTRLFGVRGTVWALAVLSVASAIAWNWAAERKPIATFYLPVFRFWEIGLGATLLLLGGEVHGRIARHAATLKALSLVGLLVLMLGLVPLGREAALFLVVVLSGGLVVMTGPGAAAAHVLRIAPVAYLGQISYSLYLWHWPVMVLFKWTVGFMGGKAWLALGIALVLAHLSHAFVEQPLRHASWGRTRWRECTVGLAFVCVVGMALVGIWKAPEKTFYLGRSAAMEAVGVDTLTEPYVSDVGTVWAGEACVLSSNAQVGKVIALEACVVGEPLGIATRRLLVIGNSFSVALVQAFDGLVEYAPELGSMSVIVTSSWDASIAPGVTNDTPWDKANAYYWAEVVPALVAGLSPGDRVLIMNDMSSFSPVLTATDGEARAASRARDAAAVGLRAFAETLAASKIELSVLGPLPFARDANCTPEQAQDQWFSPAGTTCAFLTREETRARMATTRQMLDTLEAEGVLHVLDIFDYFCDTELCDYVDATGHLLYRDVYSHPSIEAARAVRPFLAQHLLQP